MEEKFYLCRHCGNLIVKLQDHGVPIYCCGEEMQLLLPGTTDAAQEKHVPLYQIQGDRVTVAVGAAAHPMTEEHYIAWVCLQTRQGFQLKRLAPGQAPEVCFALSDGDAVEAVYAFCNLHSLWKAL